MASGLIKKRISNHEYNFRNPTRRNDTELAKFIWSLKDKGIGNFKIKWKILAKESLFNKNTRKCQLCTREKVEIKRKIKNVKNRCINKREECFTKCVHRWKHYLGNLSEHTSNTDPKLQRDIEEFHEIFEKGTTLWAKQSKNSTMKLALKTNICKVIEMLQTIQQIRFLEL